MFATTLQHSSEPSYAWLAIVTVGLFKTATIAAASMAIYLGYRLFILGVTGSSDVTGKGHEWQLTIKRAAPGTVFALFGAVVLGMTVWTGMELKLQEGTAVGDFFASV